VPEGTGFNRLILEDNLMSQVTYRGVSYDTDKRRQAQAQGVKPHIEIETYRGVKFQKEVR